MPLDAMETSRLTKFAMRAEMLDAETELQLAYAWRDHKDQAALDRLIMAYMRLAVSIAAKFKRYGAPMSELVQEASIGLLKAAEKFDPDKGVRFSTYAMWWIKASMQEFVMRNWSMVRTGSTGPQKSLFFNMKRIRANIERASADEGVTLSNEEVNAEIAKELGVPLHDVLMMEGRLMGGDASLNATQATDDEGREWVETLADPSPHAAEIYQEENDQNVIRGWIADAISVLNPREQFILRERRLKDKGRTLESLGEELGVSKERVRQIEANALVKMKQTLDEIAPDLSGYLH